MPRSPRCPGHRADALMVSCPKARRSALECPLSNRSRACHLHFRLHRRPKASASSTRPAEPYTSHRDSIFGLAEDRSAGAEGRAHGRAFDASWDPILWLIAATNSTAIKPAATREAEQLPPTGIDSIETTPSFAKVPPGPVRPDTHLSVVARRRGRGPPLWNASRRTGWWPTTLRPTETTVDPHRRDAPAPNRRSATCGQQPPLHPRLRTEPGPC
jgi:hypothetical protein